MDIRGRPLLERPPPLEHEGAPTTGAAPPLEHAGPGGVPGGRQGDGLCRKVDFSPNFRPVAQMVQKLLRVFNSRGYLNSRGLLSKK